MNKNRIDLRERASDAFKRVPAIVKSKSDNAIVLDHLHYVAKDITGAGSGTIQLVTSSSNKLVGLASFDSNKLEKGEPFMIDAVSLLYGTAATGTKKAESVSYETSAPAELLVAELVIKQDNRELVRMPVSEVHNPNTTPNVDDEYRVIGHTPILMDQKSFDIYLEFPQGVNIGNAADHFVKVKMRGCGYSD